MSSGCGRCQCLTRCDQRRYDSAAAMCTCTCVAIVAVQRSTACAASVTTVTASNAARTAPAARPECDRWTQPPHYDGLPGYEQHKRQYHRRVHEVTAVGPGAGPTTNEDGLDYSVRAISASTARFVRALSAPGRGGGPVSGVPEGSDHDYTLNCEEPVSRLFTRP